MRFCYRVERPKLHLRKEVNGWWHTGIHNVLLQKSSCVKPLLLRRWHQRRGKPWEFPLAGVFLPILLVRNSAPRAGPSPALHDFPSFSCRFLTNDTRINHGSFRGGRVGKAFPSLKCFIAHYGRHFEPSSGPNALDCRNLRIQSQNFTGVILPDPQESVPGAWTQTPISA